MDIFMLHDEAKETPILWSEIFYISLCLMLRLEEMRIEDRALRKFVKPVVNSTSFI